MPRFVGNYLFLSEKGRFSKVVAKGTYLIASQGTQRKIKREVAVVRVVSRGVVEEEVVGGKSPTHRPTKRRWRGFGRLVWPGERTCIGLLPRNRSICEKTLEDLFRLIFGAAALGAAVAQKILLDIYLLQLVLIK